MSTVPEAERTQPFHTFTQARSNLAPEQARHLGRIRWGSAFFGWVTAMGMVGLLSALLAAGGLASGQVGPTPAATIGVGGAAVLLVIIFVGYYCGGYVAGRMSRFDGARQGFGVWALGLLVTLAIAAAGAIFGDKYNVFEQLNLPRIPVSTSDLTTGGLIALAAIVLGTLLAAIAGGKVGERYHRKVDRVGHEV